MISTVEVNGVEFEVTYYIVDGCRQTDVHPGEEPYIQFESVTVDGWIIWECLSQDCIEKIEEEFGDVLFSLINYGRFLKLNPEDVLEKTNQKFIKRFNYIETKLKEKGINFENSKLSEMEFFWEEAKKLK